MSGIPTNNFGADIVLPHLAENKRVDLPLQHFFHCDSLVEDRSDCFRELSMARMEDNAGLHTIPSLQPAHCTPITYRTCQLSILFYPCFPSFHYIYLHISSSYYGPYGNGNVPLYFLVGACSSSGGVEFVLAWRDDIVGGGELYCVFFICGDICYEGAMRWL
jgi:hypothetical protein